MNEEEGYPTDNRRDAVLQTADIRGEKN